ncbi:YhcN/YlaJ family sporulation lipoprotein [Salicibibacter cibarius]|uniref:YhcN/YlaJ family sporulation lipoprotein n=1 Tax=Salicibibacter cibarius TaxID=2743000 RepID=A0A7T6Z2J7_9BACI|nr:YhcN/YlaJ family sporulation lipoprotein [Salicibibacter cibarius]QQK75546.1 YhcN/YlaJ family sporulation lipoprotein [Salicibibacter cibarius]
MKKITLALCSAAILSGLVGCGNADNHNAGEPNEAKNMEQVNDASHDQDDFTVEDRVTRDEHQGSRNKTDGRGSFYYNNPQDVTDKDTFTEEEREAEEERAQRYEREDRHQESIEQIVNEMDDIEESYVVVDDTRVIVGIRTNGDDVDQTIVAIEERLQDDIGDKELIVTDDEDQFEQMRTGRSR